MITSAWSRRRPHEEQAQKLYPPAALSFPILSVYALVLTCDSNWATSP